MWCVHISLLLCRVVVCGGIFFYFISMSIGNSKHFDGQHHRDAYTLAQTMCVLWLNAAGDFKSALLSCTEMHFLCNKRRCNQNTFGNPFQHSFYRSSFCSFGFSQLQFEMKWNSSLSHFRSVSKLIRALFWIVNFWVVIIWTVD